jgi:hypothetical protein
VRKGAVLDIGEFQPLAARTAAVFEEEVSNDFAQKGASCE